ncbi:MAG: CDGSH iron-sulfur domain-containing protein [Flavobacteriales bacterium]|nr:CDGSH iron-sulfur domain-containing protein [Flavobacteriales bacterium]
MELPKRAGDTPIAIQLEEGKRYSWCSCGLSEKIALCDGKHKGSAFTPITFVAEKTETKYFCTCKATKNPPYCDGTHKK